MISIFDLFKIGIGPSNSHTVGPMKAAKAFISDLSHKNVSKITVTLYGSLALTGIGHGTNKAIQLGLRGLDPETVDPYIDFSTLPVLENAKVELKFKPIVPKNEHANTIDFSAITTQNKPIKTERYASIGGGFILNKTKKEPKSKKTMHYPYIFTSAKELLHFCKSLNKSITDIILANELSLREKTKSKKTLRLYGTT